MLPHVELFFNFLKCNVVFQHEGGSIICHIQVFLLIIIYSYFCVNRYRLFIMLNYSKGITDIKQEHSIKRSREGVIPMLLNILLKIILTHTLSIATSFRYRNLRFCYYSYRIIELNWTVLVHYLYCYYRYKL